MEYPGILLSSHSSSSHFAHALGALALIQEEFFPFLVSSQLIICGDLLLVPRSRPWVQAVASPSPLIRSIERPAQLLVLRSLSEGWRSRNLISSTTAWWLFMAFKVSFYSAADLARPISSLSFLSVAPDPKMATVLQSFFPIGQYGRTVLDEWECYSNSMISGSSSAPFFCLLLCFFCSRWASLLATPV